MSAGNTIERRVGVPPIIRGVLKPQFRDRIIVETTAGGAELAIIPDSIPSATRDIPLVIHPGREGRPGIGVRASADIQFAAHFNRDGAKASKDLIFRYPDIAQETIETAVRFQGRKVDPQSDQKPGKYHHEHRSLAIIDDLRAQGAPDHVIRKAEAVFAELSEKWGGDGKTVTFYGAADTTPTIINLAAEFDRLYPEKKILDRRVERTTGEQESDTEEVSVKESLAQAMEFLVGELRTSDIGLLEYQHQNPKGIQNQYFKDSFTSLLFDDPTKHPNLYAPIAEIGVQGMTYDALKSANALFSEDERNALCNQEELAEMFKKPEVAKVFTDDEVNTILGRVTSGEWTTFDGLAKIIQRQVVSRYWMPDAGEKGYFANALDRDPQTGEIRKIDALQSNPAALLNTGIFDDLSESEQKNYVSGIVWMITSPEFLTEAGPRGRSLRYKNDLKHINTGKVFDDYHGVTTVWPKEVEEIIRGLIRWEQYDTAQSIMNGNTNAINLTGAHEEFHYVDERGRLQIVRLVDLPQVPPFDGEVIVFNNSNHNEKAQAWTISSNYSIKRLRTELALGKLKRKTEHDWKSGLDMETSMRMQENGLYQHVYKTGEEIVEARSKRPYRYFVDFREGKSLDSYFRTAWGCQPWFNREAEKAA